MRLYTIVPPKVGNNGTSGWLVIEQGQLTAWQKAWGPDTPVNKGITCNSEAQARVYKRELETRPQSD